MKVPVMSPPAILEKTSKPVLFTDYTVQVWNAEKAERYSEICEDIEGGEYSEEELKGRYGSIALDREAVCEWSVRGLTHLDWLTFMQDLSRILYYVEAVEIERDSYIKQLKERQEVYSKNN